MTASTGTELKQIDELSQSDRWNAFLHWEKRTKDTIDFKRTYVDMSGDVIAGLLLAQIIFWFLPSKYNGRSKVKEIASRPGYVTPTLYKKRSDWWMRSG